MSGNPEADRRRFRPEWPDSGRFSGQDGWILADILAGMAPIPAGRRPESSECYTPLQRARRGGSGAVLTADASGGGGEISGEASRSPASFEGHSGRHSGRPGRLVWRPEWPRKADSSRPAAFWPPFWPGPEGGFFSRAGETHNYRYTRSSSPRWTRATHCLWSYGTAAGCMSFQA